MNHEGEILETHRDHFLQKCLSQLEELAAEKREQLHELYHLLKASNSLSIFEFPLKHGNSNEPDDAECDAFVQLYEKGTINEINDWPLKDISPLPSPKIQVRHTRSRTRAMIGESHGMEVQEPSEADDESQDEMVQDVFHEADAEEAEEVKEKAEEAVVVDEVEEEAAQAELVDVEMVDEAVEETEKGDQDEGSENAEEMAEAEEVEEAAGMEEVEEEANGIEAAKDIIVAEEVDVEAVMPTPREEDEVENSAPTVEIEVEPPVKKPIMVDEIDELKQSTEVKESTPVQQYVEQEAEAEAIDHPAELEVERTEEIDHQVGPEAKFSEAFKQAVEDSEAVEQVVEESEAVEQTVEESVVVAEPMAVEEEVKRPEAIAQDPEQSEAIREQPEAVERVGEEAENTDSSVVIASPPPIQVAVIHHDEPDTADAVQQFGDISPTSDTEDVMDMDVSSPSNVGPDEDVSPEPVPHVEHSIRISSPAHEELIEEPPSADDVEMDDTSKDDIDIISLPTSPVSLAVVPTRRSASRRLQKLSPSPIPQANTSPSRSPSPLHLLSLPIHRPRTRSLSSALAAMLPPPTPRIIPSPPPVPSPSPPRDISSSPVPSPSPAPVIEELTVNGVVSHSATPEPAEPKMPADVPADAALSPHYSPSIAVHDNREHIDMEVELAEASPDVDKPVEAGEADEGEAMTIELEVAEAMTIEEEPQILEEPSTALKEEISKPEEEENQFAVEKEGVVANMEDNVVDGEDIVAGVEDIVTEEEHAPVPKDPAVDVEVDVEEPEKETALPESEHEPALSSQDRAALDADDSDVEAVLAGPAAKLDEVPVEHTSPVVEFEIEGRSVKVDHPELETETVQLEVGHPDLAVEHSDSAVQLTEPEMEVEDYEPHSSNMELTEPEAEHIEPDKDQLKTKGIGHDMETPGAINHPELEAVGHSEPEAVPEAEVTSIESDVRSVVAAISEADHTEVEHKPSGAKVNPAEERIEIDMDSNDLVAEPAELETHVENPEAESSEAQGVSEKFKSGHASPLGDTAGVLSSPTQSVQMEIESDPVHEASVLDEPPEESTEEQETVEPEATLDSVRSPETEEPLLSAQERPPEPESESITELPETAGEPEMDIAPGEVAETDEVSLLQANQDVAAEIPLLADVSEPEIKSGLLTTEATPGDLNTPTHISESPTRSRSGSVSTSWGLSLIVPVWDDLAIQSESGDPPVVALQNEAENNKSSPAQGPYDDDDVSVEAEEIPRRMTRSQSRARERSVSKLPVAADEDEDEDMDVDMDIPSDHEPLQEVYVEQVISDDGSEIAEHIVKIEEEDDEAADEMSAHEAASSSLSREQSDSPATSLSPAPSLPDNEPEESPTRSPSRTGSEAPPILQSIDNEGTAFEVQIASSRIDEEVASIASSRQASLQRVSMPPSMHVESVLRESPRMSATTMQVYDGPMSPMPLSPLKQHSIILTTLPAPISKLLNFYGAFDSLQTSSPNGQTIVKDEDHDDIMSTRTREGSLFSSAGASPLIPSIILPDTSLAPLPLSPILNAYSTSLILPPLEDLPSTFSRKVHPAKLARKRDREREKEEREREREKKGRTKDKEKESKDESKEKEKKDGKEIAKSGWLPWEISRWGAQFRANPAHKVTKKSGKALTTKMWNVALHELRLMRALERIEKLKQEGRWSFRQPKKQKGPAVAKSHWDWLLDELKWLRTDFREERKWKIAVAFTLAHAVREWHLADPDDRKLLCVRSGASLRPLTKGDTGSLDALGEPQIAPEVKRCTFDLPSLDEMDPSDVATGPWEDTRELDPEQEADSIRLLQREQRKRAPDILDTGRSAEAGDDGDGEDDADGEMDIDDTEVDVEQDQYETGMQVDGNVSQGMVPQTVEPPKDMQVAVETVPECIGLKDGSTDAILTSAPDQLPGTGTPVSVPIDKTRAQLRASFAHAADDAVFVDMDTLCMDMSGLSTVDPFMSLQLPELFPEFSTFQPLHATPEFAVNAVIPKGDKKSEKKDKKVMEELARQDETAASRVVNVSTFMHYKPALVSALQPAKHWRDNRWVDLDDIAVSGDDATPTLDLPPNGLFGQHRQRPPGLSPFNATMRMPKDPQRRFNETAWSDSEDQTLKQIVERYPNNWTLVADVFNSSRVTISTDKRTSWDCLARWDARWNDGKAFAPTTGPGTPGASGDVNTLDTTNLAGSVPPTPLGGPSMVNAIMTRKRSANQLNLSIHGQETESRKRRRHNHMHEAMRKSAKSRETSMKAIVNQTRRTSNAQIHENHNSFSKPANRTPAELSRLKAEKDRREFDEYQVRKKQEDELIRKRGQIDTMRQQANADVARRGQLPAGQQPAPVPTIRGTTHPQVNISQQAARLPTMNAGNLAIPNINQSVPLATGVNVNMQNFSRFTPEQQQALFVQMQARQAHVQAVQAAQQQQQGQQLQQSPQQQQQVSQQQQQPQSTLSVPGVAANNAVRQHMATPSHPQMLSHTSPAQAQAQGTAHHTGQTQNSSLQHSTPANGIGLVNMGTSNLVRAAVPQHAQQVRAGQPSHVPPQPPRPVSSQHPQQSAQMARQPTTPQQQAAIHHAFMQSSHASGMSPEQMKRLYQNQLFWQQGNAQSQVSHPGATQLAFPSVTQQQQQPLPQQAQQLPQQQNPSPPRPVSAQPNPNPNPGL